MKSNDLCALEPAFKLRTIADWMVCVFDTDSRILLTVFGRRRDEVIGQWRQLRNEKLYIFILSSPIVSVMKEVEVYGPDVEVDWLTLLSGIREVPGSTLDPETSYPDTFFVVYLSTSWQMLG
jgi:hypothetical protein